MEAIQIENQPAPNSIQFLIKEFRNRNKRNPSYSLRAFAISLNMDVGTLSRLLSGKRKLTVKTAHRLCQQLNLSEVEQFSIFKSIESENIKEKIHSAKSSNNNGLFVNLDQEAFVTISEWYHYAILHTIKTKNFQKLDPDHRVSYLSSRLQVSEQEVRMAISRMMSLGLIENVDGQLKCTQKTPVVADKNKTNKALVKLQRDLRSKAIESLENDPIEIRTMTSSTIAIDKNKLEDAKDLIYKFQKDLRTLIESNSPDETYQLTVSFFPLERG